MSFIFDTTCRCGAERHVHDDHDHDFIALSAPYDYPSEPRREMPLPIFAPPGGWKFGDQLVVVPAIATMVVYKLRTSSDGFAVPVWRCHGDPMELPVERADEWMRQGRVVAARLVRREGESA